MSFIQVIFGDPFFQSIFGSIVWSFIIFKISKDQSDSQDKQFEYGKYASKTWDNWVVTIMLGLIMVHNMGDVIQIINERTDWDLQRYQIYNFGAGVFTELVYVGIALLFGWKKKFIPEGH